MKFLNKIGPWIVSAGLCLLAVEILGAATFYWQTKSLVYFNEPKAAAAESTTAVGYKQHLHPYFGYTGPYSLQGPAFTNNLGFPQLQQREVPFKPNPDDFVVFVFGSSVAANLVSPPQGGTPLRLALQKLPQLSRKNVVIYSMAQGPGKQPQQLMELAFLIAWGQHIDFVLNLDGTLEFVSGVTNFESGIDPIFPPADAFGAIGRELAPLDTSSAEYYEMANSITHARSESRRYALLLGNSRSGLAYEKNSIFKAIYDRILQEKLATYKQVVTKTAGWEGVRKLLGLDMPIQSSKDRIMDDIFDTWIRSSDLMKVMANAQGAQFLNIVHPNPYHTKKALTESEKHALDLPDMATFRRAASEGLDLIESRSEMLRSRGVVSGITIFDDIPDTIYIDASGHVSKLGETILAEFVANQIGMRLESPQGK